MDVRLTFTLVNGEKITDTSSDFESLKAAEESCKRTFSYSTVVLSSPGATRVINVAHVVSVTVEAV